MRVGVGDEEVVVGRERVQTDPLPFVVELMEPCFDCIELRLAELRGNKTRS